MMNMFQLQERIKDFSKDQLVREMQQPSGTVPPFLVLSELQRRTRMEKAFQAEQAQGQQPTVAQDAINAAGVPQGGIADMALAMAPQTDMTGNTGAAPVQQMRTGGEVKRMQPGGLTGNTDLDEALKELEQARIRLATATRAARGDDSPLSEVSADVGSFTPAPISAAPMTSAGGLPGIDAIQNPLGRLRPTQPNMQMLVGPGADVAPTVAMAPPRMTNTDTLRENIRREGRPMATLSGELDPRFYPMSPEALPPMQGPEPESRGVFEIDPEAESGEMLERMLFPNRDPAEIRARLRNERLTPEAATFEAEAEAADQEVAALPEGMAPPIELPAPAPVAPTTAPQTGGESGGPGGTGGAGGRGRGLDTDRMLEQDKWLALAQFGLGLMASQAPTLGGAIGEAGTAALGQLGKARQAAVERDLAERTLAARSAGGRDRGALTPYQMLQLLGDQINDVRLGLTTAATPEERMDLAKELELLQQQRAGIMAASGFGPATAAAAEAGVDFNAEG